MASNAEVKTLWQTKAQIATQLGVSPRTVQRLVQRGKLERRGQGGQTVYRMTGQNVSGQVAKVATTTAPTAPTLPKQCGQPVSGQPVAGCPGVQTDGQVLAELVDRLIERNGQLERQLGEAIAIGHQIADVRDELAGDKARMMELLTQAHAALTQSNNDVRRLHSAVDSLTDAVAAVCSSPLAAPVRRRLRAALAPA